MSTLKQRFAKLKELRPDVSQADLACRDFEAAWPGPFVDDGRGGDRGLIFVN